MSELAGTIAALRAVCPEVLDHLSVEVAPHEGRLHVSARCVMPTSLQGVPFAEVDTALICAHCGWGTFGRVQDGSDAAGGEVRSWLSRIQQVFEECERAGGLLHNDFVDLTRWGGVLVRLRSLWEELSPIPAHSSDVERTVRENFACEARKAYARTTEALGSTHYEAMCAALARFTSTEMLAGPHVLVSIEMYSDPYPPSHQRALREVLQSAFALRSTPEMLVLYGPLVLAQAATHLPGPRTQMVELAEREIAEIAAGLWEPGSTLEDAVQSARDALTGVATYTPHPSCAAK